MSNLTKALAVVSILTPATGLPLSVGDIELHSALNQKLSAEIKLNLDAGENPSEVKVHLAPPEKFDRAGIPWSYFLTNIRFEPVVQANGAIVVKVTSTEALTEPFLDLLLEVSWPQGSQFREYTLLIDPPADYKQPVIPVADSSGYRVEPLEDVRPSRHHHPVKRASVAHVDSGVTPQTPTSGEFGPVHQSDTLWRIAEQLGRERGVPTRQMMDGLFKANPEAFNRNDMDSLKAGVTLKIPEMAAVQKPVTKTAKTKGEQALTGKEPGTSAKPLELVAPTEAVAETGQVKPGQDMSVANKPKATEVGDKEMQTRIEKLEQQLSLMQQMIELKDQQLAAMQNAGKPQTAVTPEPMPTVGQATPQPVLPQATPETIVQQPVEVVTPTVTVQPTPVITPKPTPQVQPVPVEHEESIFSSDTYYLAMGGLGAGMLGVLGWLLWRKRQIEEQTNTESMFASASQIRMPDSESSLSVPVMELGGAAGAYDVGTVGESSFISDFTPSDFDAFDTDQSEVDPLSEADVYLAYGRYQQAEELIRHALTENSDRDDFKLKLLEIYYAGENKEGFAAYSQVLAAEGKENDRPFWTKVSDMAKEIVPELPLFGGTGMPAAGSSKSDIEEVAVEHAAAKTEDHADDALDFNLSDDLGGLDFNSAEDLSELDAELVDLRLDFSHPAKHDGNGLDFDLGKAAENQELEDLAEPAPAEIESIDFDISSLNLASSEEEKEDAKNAQPEEIESFDFNFDVDTAQSAMISEADTAAETGLELSDFDFSGFDAGGAEISKQPEKTLSMDETAGEFDFNFDFDAPVIGKQQDDDFELAGVSDLTDMDEFETKIDLAKAYVDMGDHESAKSIAEEVLNKGSKAQKEAAKALLDELTK